MKSIRTPFVGFDVHKDSITVAYAVNAGEVELFGRLGTMPTEVDRLCKRLQSKASQVRVVMKRVLAATG